MRFFLYIVSLLSSPVVLAQNQSSVYQFPSELLHHLPGSSFTSNTSGSFFTSTRTGNTTVDNVLKSAASAPFISLSSDFTSLVGPYPEIKLIEQRQDFFAFEGGAWVTETNEVWFISITITPPVPIRIYALNLTSGVVRALNFDGSLINPNGNTYLNGKVYFVAYQDNGTWPGGLYEVDPFTLQVTTLVNSFFGKKLNLPDDVTAACPQASSNTTSIGGGPYLFFTDIGSIEVIYPGIQERKKGEILPGLGGVYRYDLSHRRLTQVIDTSLLPLPNGIGVSPDNSKLYVTNYASPSRTVITAGPTVFQYDLDSNMSPSNQRLLGLVTSGGPDGFKVDDQGRLWSVEGDGVVVRSPAGEIPGIVNGECFGSGVYPLANFGLAKDTLVILGGTKLWTVKLGQVVSANGNPACAR